MLLNRVFYCMYVKTLRWTAFKNDDSLNLPFPKTSHQILTLQTSTKIKVESFFCLIWHFGLYNSVGLIKQIKLPKI